MYKKISKIAIVSTAGFLSLAGVALAASLNGDALTLLTQKVKAGQITLQAPANVVMPEVTVNSEVVAVSGEAVNFQVDDARGTKNPAGWTATVTMSRLTDINDATVFIPFVDAVAEGNVYELTPNDGAAYYGANVADLSLGAATELVDTNSDNTSDPVTVMSTAATKGRGRFESDVTIDLNIPANSTASSVDGYASTMTFTVS